MKHTTFFILSCLLTSPAMSFDFVNYSPTLDRLYLSGLSNINSGYSIDSNGYVSYDDIGLGESINQITTNQNGSNIEGYFRNISITSNASIYNDVGWSIGNIAADFIKNTTYGDQQKNYSVIYNAGFIGNIVGDIVQNKFNSFYSNVPDGSILYNVGTIESFTGNFINNIRVGQRIHGGVIYNSDEGIIGTLTGDFIGNHSITSKSLIDGVSGQAMGGAVLNFGKIQNIISNFINNEIESDLTTNAGAIYNTNIINSINGNFINNKVTASIKAGSGAIENGGNIESIYGDFIGNASIGEQTSDSVGGAISNYEYIGLIKGDFINNYVSGNNKTQAGAIYNDENSYILNISGNFTDNHVINNSDTNLALGGAIYTNSDLLFTSDNKTISFNNNYTYDKRGKKYNAIFVHTDSNNFPTLTFNTINEGIIYINDEITGGNDISGTDIDYSIQYSININGDKTGKVIINSSIINAGQIFVNDSTLEFGSYQHEDQTAINWDERGAFLSHNNGTPVTSILLNNSSFDISNNYIENIKLNGWTATGDSYLYIDLDPLTLSSDILDINGDVKGTTKIIINTLNPIDIRDMGLILFANSTNDTTGNDSSFEIYRIYGSPFLYDINYSRTGITSHQWYLSMNSEHNPDYTQQPTPEEPDPGKPDIPGAEDPEDPNPENPESPNIENDKINVYPEVIGYIALQQVLLDQNYSIGNNLLNIKNNGIWIQPIFHEIKNNNIVDIESSIKGVDFGLNKILQQNFSIGINGLLLSGNYNLNGNGNNVYSDTSTDINATSILFGGYIKYTPDKLNFVLSLYGGKADTEILTEDGITTQAGANQLGVKAIAGYNFNLANLITLRPQISIGYTQISIEDIYDIVGKKATFEKLNHYYIESGINFNKEFKNIALYFEPSYIFTGNKGNIVNISNIASMNTITDLNLIKLKAGISLKLTNNLSVIADFKYITGKNYSNTGINAGISYSF